VAPETIEHEMAAIERKVINIEAKEAKISRNNGIEAWRNEEKCKYQRLGRRVAA
jgi:hypothetical protein